MYILYVYTHVYNICRHSRFYNAPALSAASEEGVARNRIRILSACNCSEAACSSSSTVTHSQKSVLY